MTSHAHMIIGRSGEANQEHIIRDLKRTSSKRILKAIADNVQESRKEWMMNTFREAGRKNSHNWNYQFWQQHNHPLEVTSKRKMDAFLTYIHRNPIVSGFVDYEKDYRYSSARDYCGTKGLLEIANPFI